MFDTWSDQNRVVTEDLDVNYSASWVTESKYWECRRTATMRFAYVGMTSDAASRCRTAMRERFKRDTVRIAESPLKMSEGTPYYVAEYVTTRVADVKKIKSEGSMWNVEVVVNESDVRPAYANSNEVPDMDDVFAEENERVY